MRDPIQQNRTAPGRSRMGNELPILRNYATMALFPCHPLPPDHVLSGGKSKEHEEESPNMSTRNTPERYLCGNERLSFTEAYPQIEDLEMTVTEMDFESLPDGKSYVYTMKEPPGGRFSCHNPRCKEGGFLIQDILGEMVRQRERSRKEELGCPGHELLGRTKRPCDHSFKIAIELKYRSGKVE